MGAVYRAVRDDDEYEQVGSQRESLSLARALASGPAPSASDRFEVARSLASTGGAEVALGLVGEGVAHLEEAAILMDELAARDPANWN